MTDIHMADVSEFQSNVDAPKYIAAGPKCIICRTYNGYRPDNMMPDRRDYFRGQPFTGVGWYCYLEAEISAESQAHGFIDTVGKLGANEWPILDVEEGSGSQTSRAEAWFKIVDAWAGFPAMLYASDSFISGQLSGYGHWSGRPVWVASYHSSYSDSPAHEPSGKHVLWQFTDREPMAGVSGACDCNVAHMSAADFVKSVRAGKAPAPTPKPTAEDDEDLATVVKPDGRLVNFVHREDGTVMQSYQDQSGNWTDWNNLGKPGK